MHIILDAQWYLLGQTEEKFKAQKNEKLQNTVFHQQRGIFINNNLLKISRKNIENIAC